MKTITFSRNWIHISLALVCFTLLPMLQAQNQNTQFGVEALASNTRGDKNTAIGHRAMHDNRTGSLNTATGFQALSSNTSGDSNTATGLLALRSNVSGFGNTATGSPSLDSNTTGNFNTANGIQALTNNTTGSGNTADGLRALESNTSGTGNTALGVDAGTHVTGGSYNTALGFAAGSAVTTANNVIAIGNNVSGENVSNTCYIGNIFGATSALGAAVYVNSLGKLGTVTSSKRFKQAIRPLGETSEALLALKPVAFRYKKDVDPAGRAQVGLVAEDVAKVSPDLVVRDKEGKPYSVRYDQVNAMLLNEFLKARRQIDAQQKQIDALIAGLQEVSARLETSKPAPQVAKNNQ